jgi:hypothetical protein
MDNARECVVIPSEECQPLFSFLMPKGFAALYVFELVYSRALTTQCATFDVALKFARGAGVAVRLVLQIQ